MKVVELKEELGERGVALSGNKAWLRRRLHADIASEDLETALRAPPESRMSKNHFAPGGPTFVVLPQICARACF